MSSDDSASSELSAQDAAPSVVVPWLGSIVVTALGFLPLGLVAVLLCVRADRALVAGEQTAAAKAARSARTVMWVTVGVAVVVDLAVVSAVLGLGGFS